MYLVPGKSDNAPLSMMCFL